MKDASAKLLAKAGRAIHAAEALVAKDEPEFAIGRAYYAMFYTAEALLYERDLHSKKHSGVIAMFGKHFAKTAVVDPKFHRWLLDAFAKRSQGDYGFEANITPEDAQETIAQAREFLAAARDLLEGPTQ